MPFYFGRVCFVVLFGIAFKIDHKFQLRNVNHNFETSLVVLETFSIDDGRSN